MKVLLISVMGMLQTADYVSTIRAVAHGASELNWFIAPGGRLDFTRLALAKILSIGIFALITWRMKSPKVAWLLVALFAVIVISNLAF